MRDQITQLEQQIAHLQKTVAALTTHHAEAHPECARQTPSIGDTITTLFAPAPRYAFESLAPSVGRKRATHDHCDAGSNTTGRGSCDLTRVGSSAPGACLAKRQRRVQTTDAAGIAVVSLPFIEYHHASSDLRLDQQGQSGHKRSLERWKSVADRLIQKTPKGSEWWQVMQDLGLDVVMANGDAANYLLGEELQLLDTRRPMSVPTAQGSAQDLLLQSASAYAGKILGVMRKGEALVRMSRVAEFVLLTLLFILHKCDVPARFLLDIYRAAFGNVKLESMLRYLDVVPWLNELIGKLQHSGFGPRATELLMICMCYFRVSI